jgi:multidrug efflux pump subunit AcrA (membrane-fusion protein)
LTDDVIGKVESYSFPEGEFNMVMPPYGIDNMKLEEAKAKLSKSEKKKFEKLAKERSEIAKKQAELEKKQAEVAKKQAEERKELAKKQAEIARQQAEIAGVKGKVFYYGTSAFSENANDAAKNFTKIKWSNSDALNNKNIKIYIDGKLVDKAEVEKLNPNDISSISVNKSKNNGAEDGEIKIETKK